MVILLYEIAQHAFNFIENDVKRIQSLPKLANDVISSAMYGYVSGNLEL